MARTGNHCGGLLFFSFTHKKMHSKCLENTHSNSNSNQQTSFKEINGNTGLKVYCAVAALHVSRLLYAKSQTQEHMEVFMAGVHS